jgi:hypothetical protein
MLVAIFLKVEHGGKDVRGGLYEFKVNGVVEIELKRGGSTLEAAPEEFFCFFDDVVDWECSQQVFNLVVEDVLEDVDGKFKAHLVGPLVVGEV